MENQPSGDTSDKENQPRKPPNDVENQPGSDKLKLVAARKMLPKEMWRDILEFL